VVVQNRQQVWCYHYSRVSCGYFGLEHVKVISNTP
jgi:hypothetical protein